MELGKRLRKLRLERDLTQEDLAQPRYTHAYVSTIEAGRRMPSEEAMAFFAQKLGVEVEELTTGRPKGLPSELRLRLQSARLDITNGRLEEARKAAKEAVKRAREFGLHRIEARAYEIEALAIEQSGDLPTAIRQWQKAAQLLGGEAPTARAYAVAGKIRCLTADGDPHHAVYIGETYLEKLKRERMASPSAVLRVRSSLIHAYYNAGWRAKAAEAAAECQQLIPKVNDPHNLATAYVNIGGVQFAQGHYSDANVSFAKGEELFEVLELKNEAGIALLSRGVSLSRDGKLKEARRVLENALSVLTETGHVAEQANANMELGRLDRLETKAGSAIERLESALKYFKTESQHQFEPWAHRELGLVLAKSDRARSEKHLKRALQLYELQDNPLEVARTHVMLAELKGAKDTKGQLEDYRLAAAAIHQMPEM
jgi:tetratricopeptide (TPR) repeat protein